MLKIMKYEMKSNGILVIFSSIVIITYFIINLISFKNINNSMLDGKLYQYCFFNAISYFFIVVAVLGNMLKRVYNDTELYEMAKISAIKVAAVRMLVVIIVVTAIASLFMLTESYIVYTIANKEAGGLYSLYQPFNSYSSQSLFSIYNLPWTNIFQPIFMGLYASIIYTTSFLFVAVNRRITSKIFSFVILSSILILFALLNFGLLNRINFLVPQLNLNKLGNYTPILFRYSQGFGGAKYENPLYMFNQNLLNIGLMLYQGIYVALMFFIYSLRRKAI